MICLIVILDQHCPSVTVDYTGFSITWNETFSGVIVEAPCTGDNLNGNNIIHSIYLAMCINCIAKSFSGRKLWWWWLTTNPPSFTYNCQQILSQLICWPVYQCFFCKNVFGQQSIKVFYHLSFVLYCIL